MSASSEKRKRQMDREQGVDKRSLAQREAEEKARKSKKNWTIGGILIAALVAIILLVNAFMYHIPAMKVGNATYSAAEVNYYYNNLYRSYAMYGMVNTSVPLDEQECSFLSESDEGTTWDDYFKQQIKSELERLEAIYGEAKKAGYVLSEEGKDSVQENMESLKSSAENSGFSLRAYVKRYYGEGVTPKVVEKLMTKSMLAEEYEQSVKDTFSYTDEELDAYFDEHLDDYKTYNYLYYFIKADVQEPEEGEETPTEGEETPPEGEDDTAAPEDTQDEGTLPEDETNDETEEPEIDPAVQQAIVTANGMAAYVTDEESFNEAVNAYVEGDKPQLASNVTANQVISEWITEEGRKYGETAVANGDDGAYVMMFVGSDEQDYHEISVRHILVKTEDSDEDGSYSEEELAAAKKKAEDLLAEWEAGDKTEESFAAMADEHSEDGGSNTNGGLYENVAKGTMVQEFNDFCFAEERKPGDTGIVHGSSANYDGYHVMYFVGEGPLHKRTLAKNGLIAADTEEWESGIVKSDISVNQFGMKLVRASM